MSENVVVLLLLMQISNNYCARNELNIFLFSGHYEFVDLTHSFDNETIYWPNSLNFVFVKKIEELGADGSWYAANDFTAGEHGGTHLDAPYHFYRGGLHAGELPLEKLIVPCLSEEVAKWITSSYKNVVGLGVDVASVDPGSSKQFPVHKITSRHGLYNIENVNLNRDIPEYGCTALVLPMKIKLGTGAPLRLVAICPKEQ